MPLGTNPVAVDLFCGVGGLSFGMKKADIGIAGGIDIDRHCKYPFEHNVKAPFHKLDISSIDSSTIHSLYPEGSIRVLAGCAPCQPFSTYTQKRSTMDPRWQLLEKFGSIVKDLRPEIVTMENVPQLKRHDMFMTFMRILTTTGYVDPYVGVVECTEYGIPQTRKRLVLLASRLGRIELTNSLMDADRYPTVRKFIHDLDNIAAGESSFSDPIHKASSLSAINLERIKHSRPGGTWREWPSELRAACHERTTGRTYPGVYGRMTWDDAAPTLTTQFHGFGNGRFGHPDQDRAISLREGALLQTFPVDYSFVPEGEPVMISRVATMIGNAVPVNLGKVIGTSITEHLQGNL